MLTASYFMGLDLVRVDFQDCPEPEGFSGPIDAPEVIPCGSVFEASALSGWTGPVPARSGIMRG